MEKKRYVYKVQFGEYIRLYQDVDAIVVSDKPLDEKGIIEKIEDFDYDVEDSTIDWGEEERDELHKVFNYTEIKDDKDDTGTIETDEPELCSGD